MFFISYVSPTNEYASCTPAFLVVEFNEAVLQRFRKRVELLRRAHRKDEQLLSMSYDDCDALFYGPELEDHLDESIMDQLNDGCVLTDAITTLPEPEHTGEAWQHFGIPSVVFSIGSSDDVWVWWNAYEMETLVESHALEARDVLQRDQPAKQ